MFEYLDESPEQDPTSAYEPQAPITRAFGELRLDRVHFRYPNGRTLLQDVSLELRPGTITAIVGPSGSGKSSLLRLMCRLVQPDSGRIVLDGQNATELALSDYRRQLSVVWQEFGLLRGTVRENLTYGLDPGTVGLENRVREAVRVCRLDTLIADLPHGYETPVGEWGATLSGGQRQRLAIARALVRDTPILLLDEATSQIDVVNEEVLLRELFALMRDRTVAFVTHRVGTAVFADQICVLEEGRVRGVGSHRELAIDCEPYMRLLHSAGATAEIHTSRSLVGTGLESGTTRT